LRPRILTIAVAAAAGSLTLVASLVRSAPFAYRDVALHAAIETGAALIALLAAYLIVGRLRETARLSDLILACTLCIAAFANVGAAARTIAGRAELTTFVTWWSVAVTTLSTTGFAAAAWAGSRMLTRPRRDFVAGVALSMLLLTAAAIPIVLLGNRLPPGVPAAASPIDSGRPMLVGQPIVLVAQLVAAVLYAVASVGFTRRAERTGDELMRWLGAAMALAAIARVNYFLFPSLYSNWVSTGDFLRLGFYLLLLVGVAREIREYWRRLARVAVLEERRRMARDLHDGLAQELAYIASETEGRVAAAAERALDESRRAIAALTRPVDEPLEIALAQAAEEVAQRVGTRTLLELAHIAGCSAEVREALIRVVREAVTNAGRHGRAERVLVELRNGTGAATLRIADDGAGFDPAVPSLHGFGLVSMRERVEAVGGRFAVTSAPGRGTEITVTVP
jgi:signal transduction histidine kinase